VGEVTSYHRFERAPMKARWPRPKKRGCDFSHFGPEANVVDKRRRVVPHLPAKTGNGESATTCTAEESRPSQRAGFGHPSLDPGSVQPRGDLPDNRCAVLRRPARVAWWAEG